MAKKDILEKMLKLHSECSCHLCYGCWRSYFILAAGNSSNLTETTQDANACEVFYNDFYHNEDEWFVLKDGSGNNRVSYNGFKTRDNGAGYWVINCPHYISVFEVESRL